MSKPTIRDTSDNTLHIGRSYQDIMENMSRARRTSLVKNGEFGIVDDDWTFIANADLPEDDQLLEPRKRWPKSAHVALWIVIIFIFALYAWSRSL